MPAFDQQWYLTIEEREQQRSDVAPVHVRIGHDDAAVISQLRDVEVFASYSAAKRGDQRADFSRCQHLVKARLLDVQDFPFQRQDCLGTAIAALLGRATCRIALDDEYFRL